MCIITSTVDSVSTTRIYISADHANRRQLTIYSNVVASPEENVMVLPVPNPDSVELLDFSHYPDFFTDLKACFIERTQRSYTNNTFLVSKSTNSLPVFRIGSYDASIVPSIADFPRLQIPMDRTLIPFLKSKYNAEFGFIICRLAPGKKEYHPFAYTHDQHSSYRLFIPTMHYHPGDYNADWDHLIYSPATGLFSSKYKFNTTRHVAWEKLPLSYQWASQVNLDCWEKIGPGDNRDMYIHHAIDPSSATEDDCVVM